jgi:hypothetical protein
MKAADLSNDPLGRKFAAEMYAAGLICKPNPDQGFRMILTLSRPLLFLCIGG